MVFIHKRQSKSDVGEGAERLQNILSGFHCKAQTPFDKVRKITTADRKLKVSTKETKEVKQITSKRHLGQDILSDNLSETYHHHFCFSSFETDTAFAVCI